MNQATFIDLVQSAAWLLALVELIIALYILVLHSRDRVHAHLSGLLIVFAINSFAVGSLVVAEATWQAALPTVLLAMTSPMVGTGVLLTTAVLLQPRWFEARYHRMRWVAYGVLMAPTVLTFIDLLFGAGLWYTGINLGEVSGGTIPLEAFTQGALSFPVRVIGLYITPLLAVVPIASTLFDPGAERPAARKLARWLLAAQIGALIIQFGTRGFLASSVRSLLASTLYAAVYTYATFYGLLTEHWVQHGRLRTRLTATVLVITLPTVVAAVTLVSSQMRDMALENADHNFQTIGNATASHVTTWLERNKRLAMNLAADPAIVYSDITHQQTVLDTLTAIQPDLVLAQIVGMDGISLARSDGALGTDVARQSWYINARSNAGPALEIGHNASDGTPILIAAAPINDLTGTVPGVAMVEIGLSALRTELNRNRFGRTGVAYVVDQQHQIVAAPDTAVSGDSPTPLYILPREALGPDASQMVSFSDDTGETWLARVVPIDDNWRVIVQQSRSDIMSSPRTFAWAQGLIVMTGLVLLAGLVWLSVRQALLPVDALTQTAIVVSSGDLSQVAPVQSQDEIGTLAVTFNQMTSRVRDLVQNLESRVTEQTHGAGASLDLSRSRRLRSSPRRSHP